jgi:site-specific recombinase XerD
MGDLEVIARWRRWLRGQGLSEATIRLYSYGVFRLLTESPRGSLAKITEDDIASFLSTLGNRATCRSHYFKGIRSLFAYCLARKIVQHDPTAGIRVRKPRRTRPVALSEEELTRYLMAAAWRDPRRAWTLMLAFGIGARRMEVTAIRPEDIQADTVFLPRCKYGKQRQVELNRYALEALAELRPWWNGTVVGGIGPATVTAWAHQAAEDAGLLPKIQGRVAHVLRSSFISHLLRQGVPVNVVRDLAGHENLATTDSYAAVLDDRDRKAAVDRLDFGKQGRTESQP